MLVAVQSHQTDEADLLVEEGLMYSLKVNDSLSVMLFKALKAIYLDANEKAIIQVLDIFEEKKLHVYVEAFAQSVGLFYEKKGDFEKAAEYYRKALKAQNDIQKGECLYEY